MTDERECLVEIFKQRSSELFTTKITFRGELAALPSSSNTKKILWPRGKSRPIIGTNDQHRKKFRHMHNAYVGALMTAGLSSPNYLSERIYCLVLLAKKGGPRDSHNASKPVGDWLQSVGVTLNDSLVEIDCRKKKDYPAIVDQDSTEIYIMPAVVVRVALVDWVAKIKGFFNE